MGRHGGMNRVYRVVWNGRKRVWQAAAETCGRHSGGGTARSTIGAVTLLTGALMGGVPLAVQAGELPSGGTLVAGDAHLGRQGDTLTIDQTEAWRRDRSCKGPMVRVRS